MPRALVPPLLLLVCLSGCVRRDGRNTDCRWPGESNPARPPSERHLSADAEFAEELAIEYTDAHHGPRSGHFVSHEKAGEERNRCFRVLLAEAGKTHGVPAKAVFDQLGRNRLAIDLAINLPFFLLYALAAGFAARSLWRGRGLTMVLVASLGFAVTGLLLGEVWASGWESLRVGSGHLSYRGERLIWAHHSMALFAAFTAVFWLSAWIAHRRNAGTQ